MFTICFSAEYRRVNLRETLRTQSKIYSTYENSTVSQILIGEIVRTSEYVRASMHAFISRRKKDLIKAQVKRHKQLGFYYTRESSLWIETRAQGNLVSNTEETC